MVNEMTLCEDIAFWLERKVPDLDKTTIKCKCVGSHKRLYLEWMLERGLYGDGCIEMFGSIGSELHIQTKKVENELKDLCSSLLRPIKITSNGLELRDNDNQELILILLVRLSVIYALKWKLEEIGFKSTDEYNENSMKKLELNFNEVNYNVLEDDDWSEDDDLNLLKGIVKFGLYRFDEIMKSSLFMNSKFQKKFNDSIKKVENKEENELYKFLKKRTVLLLISIYIEFYNKNKDYIINGILPLLELKKLRDMPIDMKFEFLYNSSTLLNDIINNSNNISSNNNNNITKKRRSNNNYNSNSISSSAANATNLYFDQSNGLLSNSNSANSLSNDDEINTVCLPVYNLTKNVTQIEFCKNDGPYQLNPISLANSIASSSSLATSNPNITVNSLRKTTKRKYVDQLYVDETINANQYSRGSNQIVKVPGARQQNIYLTNNNNINNISSNSSSLASSAVTPAQLAQYNNIQMTKRMRGVSSSSSSSSTTTTTPTTTATTTSLGIMGGGGGVEEYDYSIPTTTAATLTPSINNGNNTTQFIQTSTNPPSYVYAAPTQKYMYQNTMIGSTMNMQQPNRLYIPYTAYYQYPYSYYPQSPDIFSINDGRYSAYLPQYNPNQPNMQQQPPPQ